MAAYARLRFGSRPVIGTLAAFAGGAAFVASSEVVAQEGARAALEEITVTARKREESLQDVPVSVAAFSADGIEKRVLTNLGELSRFVPNLEINNGRPDGGGSAAQIFIRGVGQNDFLFPNDPGVGVYFDGVYIARTTGSLLNLLDLERVEVLRGPQGTLYGKNTIGGAINVIPRGPSGELGGHFKVTGGENDWLDLEGVLDLPLGERVSAKLAAASYNRDGYIKRQFDGQELGEIDRAGAVGILDWQASDDVDVRFTFDYSRQRQTGAPGNLLDVFPSTQVPVDPTDPNSPTVYLVQDIYNGIFAPIVAQQLGLPPGSVFDDTWVPGDTETSFGTAPVRDDNDVYGVALTVGWQINDALALKSITAYRDMDASFSRDADHSPFDIASTNNFDHQSEQLSQELQLSGLAFSDALEWLVGLYYFDEYGRDDNDVKLVSPIFDLKPLNEIDIVNYAAFGQATWRFTERLSLTFGGRYTYEEKEYTQVHLFVPDGSLFVDRTLEEDWNEFSPRLGVEYAFDDGNLVYASFAQGFKSGGWNPRPTPGNDSERPFDPETITTWEVGYKSSHLDDTLTWNTALFFSTYEDIQITTIESAANGGLFLNVQNAAENELYGFETELNWLVTPDLNFFVGAGYLHNEYTQIGENATIPEDASLQDAPEWQGVGGIEYGFDMGTWGRGAVRVDASYKDKTYKDPFNVEAIAQPAYTLVNARIAFTSRDDAWEFAVFGQNLTDEEYITNAINVDDFGFIEAYYGRPREIGVSVRYGF